MAEPEKSAGLDWVSANLAKISAILTTLVGLPPLLLSCSNQEIERRRSLQSAIATDEAAWQGLYDKYLAVVGEKDQNPDTMNARLVGICVFANRKVADLSSFPVAKASWSQPWGVILPVNGTSAHIDGADRLRSLKATLFSGLEERGIVPENPAKEAGRCIVRKDEQIDPESNLPDRPAGEASSTTPPPMDEKTFQAANAVPPPTGKVLPVNAAPESLLIGAGEKNGYDLDLFWCRGSGENDRFAFAQQAAQSLVSNKKFGAFPVGRVRVRALSVAFQSNPGYPNSGLQVRGEPSEETQALALVKQLQSQSPGAPYVYFPSSMKTPWYLSVFVCSSPPFVKG